MAETDSPTYEDNDPFQKLKALRNKHPKNIIISYINMNSIMNKFTNFASLIQNSVDVLVIAVTKLDASFPTSQFEIPGFKTPYRLDVSSSSGGLLVYVTDRIVSRGLWGAPVQGDIQVIPVELNLRKDKWLLLASYRPPCQNQKYFLDNMETLIDFHSKSSGKLLILGDLNMEVHESSLKTFIEERELYSMIKTPTCFKSVRGRCIDLLLTNSKYSFQKSQSFETGFSDFHHMIYTILKTTYVKKEPKNYQI